MVGTTLSHYTILEEIGRGGMGIVYKARDTRLDRKVAIKVLPSAALALPEDRARFYREARAAAALTHPHIAVVHEIDESVPDGSKDDDLRPFIAMEFIDGESLRDRIQNGPLKLSDCLNIAIQIASGLEAAHEKHIVHRDIKSGNVMLTAKGDAKILDFGLAQTVQSTKLTQMGSTLGTIGYMSPEQARGEEVDGRTDLWSLGVVLYEMISGRHPFPGDYEHAVTYSILNTEPEPLTAVRTGVPMDLERVVDKCLSKDPALRYQGAADLIADLHRVDLRDSGKSLAPAASKPGRETKSVRFRDLCFLAAGVAISSLAFVLLYTAETVPRVTSIRRVTYEPQVEMWPSIHPDGGMIAYSSRSDDATLRLYYRSILGGPATRVNSGLTLDETWPVYSPDGTTILFESGGALYTVGALGGVPTPVATPRPGEMGLAFPVWSPDGRKIAFTARGNSVFAMDLETRDRTEVARLPDPHSIAWSPDGERLVVVSTNQYHARTGTNIAPSIIWILVIDSGDLTQVTTGDHMVMSPVWDGEGRGIFYLSSEGGENDIRYLRVNSAGEPVGESVRITNGLNLHRISMTPDGRHLVAGAFTYSQNIWVSPIEPGRTSSAATARALTTGHQVIEGIVLSPDGKQLAYDSNVRGVTNLFVKTLATGETRQVTFDADPDYVYSWSPTGDALAFHTFIKSTRHIRTISLADNSVTEVSSDPRHERFPTWSHDGSRLGFARNRPEGRFDFVTTRRLPGGDWSPPEVLLEAVDCCSKYSPVEDLLADRQDNTIRLIDLSTGRTTMTFEEPGLSVGFFAWSPDGTRLYFPDGLDGDRRSGIWSIAKEGGEAELVLSLDGRRLGFGQIAVGEDHVYYSIREIETDIWALELTRD
jgi:serine/threonine protein kinase/DNA-binding beta-propeller fold protein YncE